MRLNIFFSPISLFPLSRILQIKTKDNYSEGKTGRVPTTLKINELLHIKYTLSHVHWVGFFFFVNHKSAQFGFLAVFSVLVIFSL